MSTAFLNLTDLQLNGTLISWREMQEVTSYMPKLLSIELGRNGLCKLDAGNGTIGSGSSIRNINLESNLCKDWTQTCRSLSVYNR